MLVKIKASGQELDMIPSIARQFIANNLAVELKPKQIETAIMPKAENTALVPLRFTRTLAQLFRLGANHV